MMAQLRQISSSVPSQSQYVATKYEMVNGVAQKTPFTAVNNGSKTTFGVDDVAYKSSSVASGGYIKSNVISAIPEKSLLTTALTATGYGALVATLGDLVASPIIEAYKAKIAAMQADYPQSTLGELLAALSSVSAGVVPVKSSIPNSKPSLLDILSQSTEHLSKIATFHEAIYKSMINPDTSKQVDVKTILGSYADSVNQTLDNKIKNVNDSFNKSIESVNDKLLQNNSYIDDLNSNFKDAIDKSFSDNKDALMSLNSSIDYMHSSINGITRALSIDGVAIQRSDKDLQLQDLQIDKHVYHSTVSPVVDMDGNNMGAFAPRDLKNIESASTARKHTDQNNFEVDDDDIDTMFTLPDISEIFKYSRLTDRLQTSLDGMTATN